jgi:hypothetical protein
VEGAELAAVPVTSPDRVRTGAVADCAWACPAAQSDATSEAATNGAANERRENDMDTD